MADLTVIVLTYNEEINLKDCLTSVKDISGLIKMPLSRHWIMHIEAANRIKI